ncbi:AAA family ATPase [Trichococcus sp. K1Tr]|uniref:ATP-binding protein n=1 Tax=Trichococcus sp. K1Tr TaxID=3020847 RepID=UPI00232D19E7|nr:AAA family ATPase [Trichococcus sp. K1Tr]MDB6352591.1 AAA family ATPase [Trichococcus sp. K1Tr]
MKIRKIEIYGYGKWVNRTFDDVQDLQVFHGKNEAGKSTLSSFINSVLFGFPSARKKDQNLYVPKQAQAYGGRLFLEDTRFGDVIVERVKDRNKGQALVTLPDGVQQTTKNLGRFLLGMDRETFESLYTFKIDSLLSLKKTQKEELNHYLLSIGTSGSERLLQLAKEYRDEAAKRFKPTGSVPPLNKKIQAAEKLQRKLQQAKAKNATYETSLLQLSDSQKQQAELLSRQQELEQEQSAIAESLRLADSYQEWKRLNKEITAVDYSEVPEDASYQWQNQQEKMVGLIQAQTQLQERLAQLQKQLGEFVQVEWYKAHQSEFAALQHSAAKTQADLNKITYLENEISNNKADLAKQKMALGLNLALPAPEPLNEEERGQLQQLAQDIRQIEEQLLRLDHNIGFHEEQLETLQQEEIRLQHEKLTEEAYAALQSDVQQPNQRIVAPAPTKRNPLGMMLLAAAVVFVILSFVLADFRLIAWVLAILLAVGGVFLMGSKPQTTIKDAAFQEGSSENAMEQFLKQAAVRDRISAVTREFEELQDKFLELLNNREELEERGKTLKTELETFLQQKGYPARMTATELLQLDPGAVLAEKSALIIKQEAEMDDLNLAVNKWNEQTAFIRSRFHFEHLTVTEMAARFSEIQNAVVLEESMAANVQDKINELQRELEQIQRDLAESHQQRQRLLDQANAKTEAEFYQLLALKEKQEQNLKRKELLDGQISGREQLLDRYGDAKKSTSLYEKNELEMQRLKAELSKLQRTEVELKHQLEQLEEGGTYSALLQEFALAETELRDLAIEWAGLVTAGEWIEGALRYGKEDRLPLMLDDTITFFRRLTEGAYTGIAFQKNGMKVQRKDGTTFLPNELSQGTVEQLYIALRLAFVKNTADIVSLPILIDDGFVNFDEDRKNIMFTLLEELSEDVQVLFFTFDDACVQRFSQKQVYMLK